MPYIIDTSVIDFEYSQNQSLAKTFTTEMFKDYVKRFPKLQSVFDNTQIEKRNFCVPYDFFLKEHKFKEVNDIYQNVALEYGKKAVQGNPSEKRLIDNLEWMQKNNANV